MIPKAVYGHSLIRNCPNRTGCSSSFSRHGEAAAGARTVPFISWRLSGCGNMPNRNRCTRNIPPRTGLSIISADCPIRNRKVNTSIPETDSPSIPAGNGSCSRDRNGTGRMPKRICLFSENNPLRYVPATTLIQYSSIKGNKPWLNMIHHQNSVRLKS